MDEQNVEQDALRYVQYRQSVLKLA
ncbi:hypothetical protein D043_4597A, partial [Vibrio parahaemolyticus EKP-021]